MCVDVGRADAVGSAASGAVYDEDEFCLVELGCRLGG